MSPAQLFWFTHRDDCAMQLAADLSTQLRQGLAVRPRASLLLPGGTSPQALLPRLREQALEWDRVDVSPTDERWVAADDPHSNWRLLANGLPQANCLDPRQAATPEAAASTWAEHLVEWQPFDAGLLGMGDDAHFASLFPGRPELAAALDLEAPSGALLGLAPASPQQRLSLNLSMLCASRWLGLLAFGAGKRELLEAVLADQAHSRAWPLHALVWQSRQPLRIYWAP
ncbi:6-phosphogluconolactonase [Pseudomonas sp. LS44]|uniref:6-phosphogluconolactonase n=1 Tax=Pseudomonas sp. LS44 TaxID=1357074 RepID=UPI00215A5865|nr:6-phosphogluconolactonase [Pseudomonas sp. LS44]UVE19054.1 6-phosphogluconolactonase [Pseudomonas sp. LS44]